MEHFGGDGNDLHKRWLHFDKAWIHLIIFVMNDDRAVQGYFFDYDFFLLSGKDDQQSTRLSIRNNVTRYYV